MQEASYLIVELCIWLLCSCWIKCCKIVLLY